LADCIATRSLACFDPVEPGSAGRGTQDSIGHLGKLTAHTNRHSTHLFVEFAIKDGLVSSINLVNISCTGGSESSKHCNAVGGRSLLDGNPHKLT
jgi:hypothetical protein